MSENKGAAYVYFVLLAISPPKNVLYIGFYSKTAVRMIWPCKDEGFEPALLPQETICLSVSLAKEQIGNSRGQKIFY